MAIDPRCESDVKAVCMCAAMITCDTLHDAIISACQGIQVSFNQTLFQTNPVNQTHLEEKAKLNC